MSLATHPEKRSIVLVLYWFMCTNVHLLLGEAGKDLLWNPVSVPKRMRSELRRRILSPAERLLRQLYNNQQESDFEDIVVDDKTVTLIYASNKYIPPNEIGLEAMLLVSPTTTAERSVSPSQKVDDNAFFSMNILVEKPLVSPTTTTEFSVSVSNGRRLCLFLNECFSREAARITNYYSRTFDISIPGGRR
ncbi:putative protein isoform X1 [Capsicum chacoense]